LVDVCWINRYNNLLNSNTYKSISLFKRDIILLLNYKERWNNDICYINYNDCYYCIDISKLNKWTDIEIEWIGYKYNYKRIMRNQNKKNKRK
jgi:hypothetical protein